MHVKLLDLMAGISRALDLISPAVVGHHRRTAELAANLAHGLDLCSEDVFDIFVAGLVHDIGAFSTKSRLDALEFDSKDILHAEHGYRLLSIVPHLSRSARIIRLHHTPWKNVPQSVDRREALLANVLYLADRIDVADIDAMLLPRLCSLSGTLFAPEAVSSLDDGILEAHDKRNAVEMKHWAGRLDDRIIPDSEVLGFANAFAHVIDFRSRFTATHSCGVAETAEAMGELVGMNAADVRNLRLAGLLHDIGKLAVPSEIIEKPDSLSEEEFKIVRSHPLVCEDILGAVSGFADVRDWASQHHERLNGEGYPHGLTAMQLSQGSRIMAVADVFTALTEDRPYREGMEREQALSVLRSMSKEGILDIDYVTVLCHNFSRINNVRVSSQQRARSRFRAIAA